jgi:hypothetical protein
MAEVLKGTSAIFLFTGKADRLLCGLGELFRVGHLVEICKLGGTIQDNAQTHQGPRGACGALSLGVAHRIAVEAKNSMIKGNG